MAGSPWPLNPSAMAAHPSGQFLLVTQYGVNHSTLATFRVNAIGSLSLVGSPVSLGEFVEPRDIVVDPGGQWIYVPMDPDGAAGFFFDPNTGVPTPIPGSPFLSGDATAAMIVYAGIAITESVPQGVYFSKRPRVAGGNAPYSWYLVSRHLANWTDTQHLNRYHLRHAGDSRFIQIHRPGGR